MIRYFKNKILSIALRGETFYCPLCERGFDRFLPAGLIPRPNAKCPGCRSLERHRALWAAFQRLWSEGRLSSGGRLLHVAPERQLSEKLSALFDYVSIDLMGRRAMKNMDVTGMSFADHSFEVVICNHVLEHVPEDRKAIAELYRVLKPGGWGAISVPMGGAVTDEDPSVTDAEERLRRFGQKDHVRQYGLDFWDRLTDAGFALESIDLSKLLGPVELGRIAADREVTLVRRPEHVDD